MNFTFNPSVSFVDLSIVATYLIASLLLGIRAGRKTLTMRDYAVASQSYDTPVLVCTIFATWVGAGSTLGNIERIYAVGLIWVVYILIEAFKMLMVSEWIAPRMQPFLKMLSVGDIMGSLYGRYGKFVTGLAAVGMSIGVLAIQATAIGYVFQYYLNLSPVVGSILGWSILLIYSAKGGMRAVTVTDVMQFSVLMVGIPFLCLYALQAVGGPLELYLKLPESHCALFPKGEGLNDYWTLWTIALIPMMDPAIFQRLLMLQDPNRIRNAFRTSVLLDVPLKGIIGLISLMAVVLYPGIDKKFIVPTMIQDLLPVGIKGFVIAGVLAVIMSTADSVLHVASLGLVRDTLSAFRSKKFEDAVELRLSRIAALVIGVIALYIALGCEDIKALGFAAVHCWAPVVLVPLVAGIFGLRTKPITFIFAVIAGFGTAVVWKFRIQPVTGIDSLLPAIAANALTFYVTHCVLHPGTLSRWCQSLGNRCLRPFSRPKSEFKTATWTERIEVILRDINNFCKEKTDTHGIPYPFFGFFIGAAYLAPYIVWAGDSALNDSTTFIVLRGIAWALCIPLALQASWPKALKAYTHVYWYITVCYCLPAVPAYMLFAGDGSLFWWINFALSLVTLLVILDYVSFIFVASFGIGIALTCSKYFCIQSSNAFTAEGAYVVGYCYLFASFSALFLVRSREYIERQRQAKQKEIGARIGHRIQQLIGNVEGDYRKVSDIRRTLSPEIVKQYPEISAYLDRVEQRFFDIHQGTHRTVKMVADNVQAEATLDDPSLGAHFELKPQSLKESLQQTMQGYSLSKDELESMVLDVPEDVYVRADATLLSAVLGNLIHNALSSMKASGKKNAKLSVTFKPDAHKACLIIQDTGAGLDAECVASAFEQYASKLHQSSYSGLPFCKKAMTKMLGDIELHSKPGEFTTVVLTFRGVGAAHKLRLEPAST